MTKSRDCATCSNTTQTSMSLAIA